MKPLLLELFVEERCELCSNVRQQVIRLVSARNNVDLRIKPITESPFSVSVFVAPSVFVNGKLFNIGKLSPSKLQTLKEKITAMNISSIAT